MVVRRCMSFVSLTVIVVAMSPEDQLLENKKQQDAGQHGSGHPVRIRVLEGMWQDFQKNRPQQVTDRVRNERIDAMSPEGTSQSCCGNDT